jgi:hypothetical protein
MWQTAMTTAARAFVLVAVPVFAAGVGAACAWLAVGSVPVVSVCSAVVLCAFAALPTFVLADVVMRKAPDFGPAAVMAGTAVRMGVAVVGVLLFGDEVAARGENSTAFAGWVAALYVVTLITECALLIRRATVGAGAAQ